MLLQIRRQGTAIGAGEVGMRRPGEGLVQMDMSIHQPRQHQLAWGLLLARTCDTLDIEMERNTKQTQSQ